MTPTQATPSPAEVAFDWQHARKLPRQRATIGADADIFAGKSYWEQCEVERVKVARLTVMPRGARALPASFAVVAEPHWKPVKEAKAAIKLEWQQSREARFDLFFDLPEGVRCLGLGERYSGLDLRGAVHTLCTTDDTHHTESIDSTYKAFPFVILQDGNTCSAIFIDTSAPTRFDLDSELSEIGNIEIYSRRPFQVYVLGPASLANIISAYTHLTGRSQLPPRWALGHQQCRWSYPDEKTVRDVARKLRANKIPTDTIVLDIDYMDEYRVFTTSKQRFPNFARLIRDLADADFRTVTIVDPGVKQDAAFPIYSQGKKEAYFCTKSSGETFVEKVWPGLTVFPDFLQDRVRKWWGANLQFYTDRGVAGIWNDMNEPAFFGIKHMLEVDIDELPPDREHPLMHSSPEGRIGHLEVRNLYGSLMCRATYEGLQKHRPNQRQFILTRSASPGIQRYAAVWLGDNTSWYEHLRKSIPMLLNMGLSGVPFCGVDVGGFGADCLPELLIRWYETGIFYPFFRNHCWITGRAQEPYAYSDDVMDKVRRLIETRYRLLPYIAGLFWEHWRTGAPLMRPLSWHYGDDPIACEIDNQFMLGSDILVAPILERGQRRRAVYLPKGRWYRFEFGRDAASKGSGKASSKPSKGKKSSKSGSTSEPLFGSEPLTGGKVHILEMPLGAVPAFVREGAIIPMTDVMQSTNEYSRSPITFHVFGATAKGKFIDDDGASTDHLRGAYNEWMLAFANGKFRVEPMHSGYKSSARTVRYDHNGSTAQVKLPL